MARFLIDTRTPTPRMPERHRGAVIAVVDDGHVPGRKETLEQGFAWIDVPTETVAAMKGKARGIIFECVLDVLSDDPVADLRSCRIHNKNKNSITAPFDQWGIQLDVLIGVWGFTNPVTGTEERTADGEGENLTTSEGLWGAPLDHVTADYDPGTGIRQLSSNYSTFLVERMNARGQLMADQHGVSLAEGRGLVEEKVELNIESIVTHRAETGTVDHETRQITSAWDREKVLPLVQADLTDQIDFQYVKRRHRFTEAVVAQAEAAGGITTAPISELVDRATL